MVESAVIKLRRRRKAGTCLAWRHTEMPLIDAAEMLRIAEPECVGDFAHSMPASQHFVGPRHKKPSQEHRGRIASQFLHKVAEIVRRQEQLLRTVTHGGESFHMLFALFVVVVQQRLQASQQVGMLAERDLQRQIFAIYGQCGKKGFL